MKEIIKNFDFDDYYELKENLGEGDFAVVQKCIKKSNGKIFAVKKVLKKKNQISKFNNNGSRKFNIKTNSPSKFSRIN